MAAAVVALRTGLPGVLDFALGLVLGALTMSGLRAMVGGLGPGPRGPRQTLLLVVHLLKYPLILGVLYVLVVSLRRNALLLLGGYTLSLVVFLVHVYAAAPRAAGAEPKA
ncbi:hypothetical protein LLH23_06330 [bacterium]|nr:hypothetical protein [bacterium]